MSRILFGLVLGVLLGGAGMELTNAQPEIVDFAIVVEPSVDGAELSCVRGCAWRELSFSCDGETDCRAEVDASGVGGVEADPPRR